MAEENAIASPKSSVAAADSHKRKLEELETKNATEPLTESESVPDPHSDTNGAKEEENAGADESEAKRQRLERNGDDVSENDAPVSLEDGHQDNEEEVEPSQEGAGNESKSVDIQEPLKEDPEASVEEPPPIENEDEKEKNNEDVEEKENEDGKAEDEEAKQNEKTEPGNSDKPEQPQSDVEEPSEELPKVEDVPALSAERQPESGSQVVSRRMEVPNDKVGVLIGKAGDTIRSLQDNSGAKIQIVRDADADPRAVSRPLELVGTLESINKAEKLIKDVIAEADAGGSPSLVARGFSAAQAASGGEQLEIQVPIEKVGLIIGKGGETIRNLQTKSGARIQLIQQNADGDQTRERTVRITGNKKQIENAREMIKDVMNQTVRPSPLSSRYDQQGSRPRQPAGAQWGPRGPHHGQFSNYDYPQRGSYPPQNSQYPPSYGNYPPPQGPRSNFGPSWEQRPPASYQGPSAQGGYNYGQHGHGQDYGHPPPYSQSTAQPYGHGYNEAKYDSHSSQHYGPMGSQPTPYGQGGAHSGYGQQDQYGKPPMYGMQPQAPQPQHYSQARPNQPSEVPYQGPGSSAQLYGGRNMPPQQQSSYPYPSTGAMQQSYPPPYGSAPTTDGGYGHTPATSGYGPQGGQPVAGYGQSGAQQPPAYNQTGGPAGGYGSYPTPQPGYAEQPTADNTASYGYQGPTDPAYATAQAAPSSYPATAAGQSGYAQPPPQVQPGAYDQSGGYGSVPPAAGYGKTVSPQPAAYPQYDSSQVYGGAHR